MVFTKVFVTINFFLNGLCRICRFQVGGLRFLPAATQWKELKIYLMMFLTEDIPDWKLMKEEEKGILILTKCDRTQQIIFFEFASYFLFYLKLHLFLLYYNYYCR